jgi:hypothetical protein
LIAAVSAPGRPSASRYSGGEVAGAQSRFGQPRQLEEEHVPASLELVGVPEVFEERQRVGRVEDGEPLELVGVAHGEGPGDAAAPVVPDHRRRPLLSELLDAARDVAPEAAHAICF